MSLEIILDILLSAVAIAIYRSDCAQQSAMAYACVGSEPPLWGNHEEFYRQRMVRPENYESIDASHLITEDDVWVADPMDALAETLDAFVADESTLTELFAAADAIEPMEAEVSAELAAIYEEVDLLLPVRTKSATVVQLRALAKVLSKQPVKGNKAELAELVLNAFADRGILHYVLGGVTFTTSYDDRSILAVLK